MFSLKYIRDNIELIENAIKYKNVNFDLNDLIENDKKRRNILVKVESLKAERNIINKDISSKKNIKSKSI